MTKEIIWTHPVTGLTHITIPADNVYVPAGIDNLQPEDFVTLDENILGVTIDGESVTATHRKATIEEIASRDIPLFLAWEGITDAVEFHIADREKSMSMDNYFRDAWVHDKGNVSIDLEKAVPIQQQKLREVRASEFSNLDVLQLRKIASGDSVAVQEIEARKQALRDVTRHPALEAATTPEELKLAGMDVINQGE